MEHTLTGEIEGVEVVTCAVCEEISFRASEAGMMAHHLGARHDLHSIVIEASPASGDGDIDGFELSCTCGLIWTTSVTPNSEALAHLAWHDKKAGK